MSTTKKELQEKIKDLEFNLTNPLAKDFYGKFQNLLVQYNEQLADLEAAESKVAETKAAEVKAAEAKPSEAKVEKVKQVSEKKQEAKKELKKEVKQTKEVVKKAKAVLDKVKAKMKKAAPTPPPTKPVKIVEKAKAKVAKAKIERAEPTTKLSKNEKVEAAIKLAIKLRREQGVTWKRTAVERDAQRASKGISRISSVTGKEYKEYRENRMDRKPKRYPRLEHGGGVSNDVDTLELYFHDRVNFNKAKLHFESDSIFTPEEINEEFKCFSFNVEDMDDADSTEFGIEQELQETDLSGYHFEIENEEYADGGTLGAGSFAEGGTTLKGSKVKDYDRLKIGKVFLNGKEYKGDSIVINGYNGYTSTKNDGLLTAIIDNSAIDKNKEYYLLKDEDGFYIMKKGARGGHFVLADGGTLGAGSFAEGGTLADSIKPYRYNFNTYIKIEGTDYGGKLKIGHQGKNDGTTHAYLSEIEWDDNNVPDNSDEIETLVDNNLTFLLMEARSLADGGTLGAGSFAKGGMTDYKEAMEKFNDTLLKNESVLKLSKHYDKTTQEIVKHIQPRISVLRYNDKSIKEVKIDFKDTNSGIEIKEKTNYADGGTLGAGGFAEGGEILSDKAKKVFDEMIRTKMDRYKVSKGIVGYVADDMGIKLTEKEKEQVLDLYISKSGIGTEGMHYADGGTLGAGSFAFGGEVEDYKIRLEFWFANVYEDDYNEGQGKEVNYFNKKENQTFDSADDLVRYISSNILYTDVSKEDFALIGEGQIGTSIMVDADNSPADKTEIELWKKGEFKLYSADYNFTISFVIEKEPTEEELIKLFGRDRWANGGQMSLFKKGGKLKRQLLDEEKSFLSDYKYIPKGLIQEIEVERRGKTTFIDGADVLDGNYVRKEIKFADGGSLDKNGVKYALLEFVSSGTIANFTDMVNYKDIDGIRLAAVQILNRDGDAPYSLTTLKSVLLQAKDEYLENKHEGNYGKGGFFGTSSSSRYNEGTAWQNDHYEHNKEEKYEVPMSERKFIRKNGETHRRND